MQAVRVQYTFRSFSTQLRQCVLKKNSANPFEAYEVRVQDIVPPSPLGAGQVRTRFLSSIVTHKDVSDMRTGSVNNVAGDSAMLEVIDAGSNKSFAKGDRVQAVGVKGLWQTEPVLNVSDLLKLPKEVSKANFGEYLAHAQAIAMLKNEKLNRYDEIAVTEAQGPLGSAVCRVGKQLFGLKVLAVVGLSYDNSASLDRLKACGSDVACVSEFERQVNYVGSHAFRRLLSDWKGLKVVVNGDGGLNTHELVRHMAPHGKMYVLGGGAPITLPTSVFAQKKITLTFAPAPTEDDYLQAAKMMPTLTEAEKVKSAEFDFGEVYKAVDAFGLGPVCMLTA